MAYQTRYFSFLTLGLSTLALGACGHPNAMPSGYSSHHNTYKSPAPAETSPKVTAQQRQYMDAAQAEQFRDGVYDLLTRLTNRAGMPPKPVYVMTPKPLTSFYANIDNDLRESMRHIGYAISDTPVGAYVFAYSAMLLTAPRDDMSTGHPNVDLTLRVYDGMGDNARMLSEESGRYYIQGAETLNIKPASYEYLPSYRQVQNQAAGIEYKPSAPAPVMYKTPAPRATSTSFSTAPAPSLSTGTESMRGRVSQEIDIDTPMNETDYRRQAPVDIQLNQYSSRAAGNAPSYATSINTMDDGSAAVTVSPEFSDPSMRPATSTIGRARISKEVEY